MKKLLLTLLAIIPLFVFAQVGKTYHVTSQSLNLRAEPTTNAEILDKLDVHDNVIVLNDTIKPGWYQVDFGGGFCFFLRSAERKMYCKLLQYAPVMYVMMKRAVPLLGEVPVPFMAVWLTGKPKKNNQSE